MIWNPILKMPDKSIGYTVNREEWAKRSLFDQLGNIGSEVGHMQFAMAARMKRQV